MDAVEFSIGGTTASTKVLRGASENTQRNHEIKTSLCSFQLLRRNTTEPIWLDFIKQIDYYMNKNGYMAWHGLLDHIKICITKKF